MDHAPGLGRYKRLALAAMDSARPVRSYAQHGEDAWLCEQLAPYRIQDGMYVDVGANHPMTLSNTYRFYRAGCSGVVVEPFDELAALHRRFRPRDLTLQAACGEKPGVAKLHVGKAPVLSSLSPTEGDWKVLLTPVITLDDLAASLPEPWIFLLSVDVEGHDAEVLRGGGTMLARVFWLCVEVSTEQDEREICALVEPAFELVAKRGCNLLFRQPEDRFAAWRR